jgi:putative aminopeptidase FrvX
MTGRSQKLEDMFIDIGAKDREDAEKKLNCFRSEIISS